MVRYAILCRARGDLFDGNFPRPPGDDRDIDPGLLVEALLLCCVVTSKLKLMNPAEL